MITRPLTADPRDERLMALRGRATLRISGRSMHGRAAEG